MSEDRRKITLSESSLATNTSNSTHNHKKGRRPKNWVSFAKPFVRCVVSDWRKKPERTDLHSGSTTSSHGSIADCHQAPQDALARGDEHTNSSEEPGWGAVSRSDSGYQSGRSRSPPPNQKHPAEPVSVINITYDVEMEKH